MSYSIPFFTSNTCHTRTREFILFFCYWPCFIHCLISPNETNVHYQTPVSLPVSLFLAFRLGKESNSAVTSFLSLKFYELKYTPLLKHVTIPMVHNSLYR
jgi:hypothetical protein